jgi:hypothetical protein
MMIDDAMTFVMFLKCQNDFSLAQWRHGAIILTRRVVYPATMMITSRRHCDNAKKQGPQTQKRKGRRQQREQSWPLFQRVRSL